MGDRRLLHLVIGIGIIVTVAVLIVARHIEVVRLGYNLERLEQEAERLEERNRNLRAEVAAGEDLRRLTQRAQAMQLAIAPPESQSAEKN
jgi:cell division protein FtsL